MPGSSWHLLAWLYLCLLHSRGLALVLLPQLLVLFQSALLTRVQILYGLIVVPISNVLCLICFVQLLDTGRAEVVVGDGLVHLEVEAQLAQLLILKVGLQLPEMVLPVKVLAFVHLVVLDFNLRMSRFWGLAVLAVDCYLRRLQSPIVVHLQRPDLAVGALSRLASIEDLQKVRRCVLLCCRAFVFYILLGHGWISVISGAAVVCRLRDGLRVSGVTSGTASVVGHLILGGLAIRGLSLGDYALDGLSIELLFPLDACAGL